MPAKAADQRAAAFAPRLAALLAKSGMTVYRLSALSGVRQTAIHKLLKGERVDPYWSTVCKLADALGVGVGQFR